MPVSKAQQKAVVKYVKNKYDRHMLTMPKGKKSLLQSHASERSESLNGFVNRAIDCQMERDKAPATVEEPEAITTEEPPEARPEARTQPKPTDRPTKELVETWLRLSDSGLGARRIELMPESGGFRQTTIKKYVRLARAGEPGKEGVDAK